MNFSRQELPASHAEDSAGPRLADLVDAPMLRSMLDDFHQLTSIPLALIDLEGIVIVGVGWQEACTKFHRVNPDTRAHCIASDTILTAEIPAGEAKIYKCRNGMWDAATPIYVGSRRVGNLFTGQFFFDDESVDLDFFRIQARNHAFDEVEYLAAIGSVPRLSRSTVDTGIRFLTKLSSMISQLSYSNMERAQAEIDLQLALGSKTVVAQELAAERSVLQAIMDNTETHLAYLDEKFNFVAVNKAYETGSGYTESQLVGRNHFELFPDPENQAIFEHARNTGQRVEYKAKPFLFEGQAWRGVTYWDWRLTPIKNVDGRIQGFAFSLLDVSRNVRQKAFSDGINALNDVIHSNLDFHGILAKAIPALASPMECEVVLAVLRTEDGQWQLQEAFGVAESEKGRTYSDEQLPRVTEAVESGHPVVITPQESTQPGVGIADLFALRSLLIAPLAIAGSSMGAIVFGYVSGPGDFDDYAVDFAGKIAASLSMALKNARLYENEHYIADRLQAALLELPTEVGGLEFAHSYHSASEAARVGGDFYDIFELDADHVGLTIGDVAGKGLDAAVLTSLAKNAIRAHASERGKTPARVLELANRLAFRSTGPETFVTLFFGILDCQNGRLVYANAGHPGPLIAGSGQRPITLATTGPPLGALESASFGEAEASVEGGDILFLYTDGLTEARDPNGMYGDPRLCDVLSAVDGEGAEQLVERVIADVMSFTDGQLSDDMAILAMKRVDNT